MKGSTYKSIVRGNISSNLSKAMISSATPFKIINSMEIVNRVLTLESLILVSDVLYGGGKFLTIHCNSVEETKALEFLVSLSDTLTIEKTQSLGTNNCYLVSFTHGATYRSLVIEDEFINFFFDTFQNMRTSSNFVSLLNDEIDRLIMECYCIDTGVDLAQLKFSLRNKGLSSKLLDLDAIVGSSDVVVNSEGIETKKSDPFADFKRAGICSRICSREASFRMYEAVEHLESKYTGLRNLDRNAFIVDIRDFETILNYFNRRYGDSISLVEPCKLHNKLGEIIIGEIIRLSFDYRKVLSLVDALYMGTYYSELYNSKSFSEFSKDMRSDTVCSHYSYLLKDYNTTVYSYLERNRSNTFELYVHARFKDDAKRFREYDWGHTN